MNRIDELKKGEHETVEYKQDIPKDKDKYLKTAVAFANAAGGRLIFGVENNSWNVIGFSDDEVFQKYDSIANSIYDASMPAIVPIMGIEEIEGKKIIVANILPGMSKPYYLRSSGMMEGTYIRVAGVTRKAEPYMIRELQLEGSNTSFDTLQVVGDAIPSADIEALCDRMHQHALFLCKNDEQRRQQAKLTVRQLVSWRILVLFQDKYYPTNAWKLLTGDIDELFPDAFIQLAAFKGKTRSVFLDRQEARGPVDQQIEDAMLFVKKHINLGSRIAGVYREDYYELPIDSVREMISNAVCHRSYLSPGSIQVAVYDDRLEVTSPGRLSPDLTIDRLIEGNSRVRNVAIGAAFQYMHIIEKWRSGIPRIFDEARAYSLGDPEIKDFGTSFRINIFRRSFETDPFGVIDPETKHGTNDTKFEINDNNSEINDTNDTNEIKDETNNAKHAKHETNDNNGGIKEQMRFSELSENEKVLLLIIKNNARITQKNLAAETTFSLSTVKRIIPALQEKGVLRRKGNHRKGEWEILIPIDGKL